jgi:hypothetical protein
VYAKDFGKNEVALARYLRGVGFKSFATYPENRHWTRPKARPSIGWEHDSGTRKAARAGLPMLGRVV